MTERSAVAKVKYTIKTGLLKRLFLVAAVIASAVLLWAAEPYTIEQVELKASGELPDKLAEQLDSQGIRLITESNGLRVEICELFWAKTVIAQAQHPTHQPHYRVLAPGALVGVIHFPPQTSEDYREDFHDQKLKAGYYSMRYAMLQEEEGHDVVLLSRADHDVENTIPIDELKRRSRIATGTNQPAILKLVSPELGNVNYPGLRTDDQGTCIVQVKLHVKSTTNPVGEFAFAMIVVTPQKEQGGS
jgi:hypothetical protein